MERESQRPLQLVTGIHLNLVERYFTFDVDGEPAITVRLAPFGVTLEPSVTAPPLDEADAAQEAQRTLTLSGRLKATPRPGRADRNGNPTAYARFAAHVEGEDQAHDYIATFHRHTATLALRFRKEDQITVEGYAHPSSGDRRLDTFSVVNLLRYPGMAEPRPRHTRSTR